ncbi:alpha-L-fucosidase [Pinibacter soli]|uniref:alpha-L-fucosidase n=1 Tax=Pinibacter soli TaxID=3044211 RepID=A0ABT6RF51_9BACT|nr:alpha-L-fucosidase [Pinibacter soli]MDI3321015.1 alpha-L-fucosidase [Pinibacter soli]
MKKSLAITLSAYLLSGFSVSQVFAQPKDADKVKMEHAQIGIVEDNKSSYKHTTHPNGQWFPQAGFGMFIHWSIASVKEIDLSWPMMAGTQIGWSSKKPSQDSVDRFVASGNFFAGNRCEKNNSCITPIEYWSLAKYFDPKNYDPEKWIKAAKEAGMTYVVLTSRHHDGFAMWPSAYGNLNTKNYMGGRDLVKEFVTACRKYGLKVGLYYSGPDWHENGEFQDFMYYGVSKTYSNVPALDENLKPRTAAKTEAEKQAHYEHMAAYVKGQVEELLTNYGRIDMIWFDGSADIPRGNKAWDQCISMERIQQLQPGIIVSPRFFGYGDYKTFEGDKALPAVKQDGWAELCTTITQSGWGYTKNPMKSTAHVLEYLIRCRSFNTNMLLNYGPTKDGVFTPEMYKSLSEIAAWMKVNGPSIQGVQAIDSTEYASVPATAGKGHRYLFLIPQEKGETIADEKVVFNTNKKIKKVQLVGSKQTLKYSVENNQLTVFVPATVRTALPDVIDVVLN